MHKRQNIRDEMTKEKYTYGWEDTQQFVPINSIFMMGTRIQLLAKIKDPWSIFLFLERIISAWRQVSGKNVR